jgi:hypothetical protein
MHQKFKEFKSTVIMSTQKPTSKQTPKYLIEQTKSTPSITIPCTNLELAQCVQSRWASAFQCQFPKSAVKESVIEWQNHERRQLFQNLSLEPWYVRGQHLDKYKHHMYQITGLKPLRHHAHLLMRQQMPSMRQYGHDQSVWKHSYSKQAYNSTAMYFYASRS